MAKKGKKITGNFTPRKRKIRGKKRTVWVRRQGTGKGGRPKYQIRRHNPLKYKKGEKKPSYSKKRDRARIAKHTRGRRTQPWSGDRPGSRI
jgi:hypothetical protein